MTGVTRREPASRMKAVIIAGYLTEQRTGHGVAAFEAQSLRREGAEG